ncbi:hypothetical protein Taro_031271 [Colocasia esculenta]|uniref:PORR domain-containing protein n=1 Tax=Colocasia esculenta TaxID=4460 RepID=A0A843VW96_COLES|nr:hypothetical protein [Colocasia esculenta]
MAGGGGRGAEVLRFFGSTIGWEISELELPPREGRQVGYLCRFHMISPLKIENLRFILQIEKPRVKSLFAVYETTIVSLMTGTGRSPSGWSFSPLQALWMTKSRNVQDRSKKKRVQYLERATERWKVASKVLFVMEVLKKEPERIVPSRRLEQYRQQTAQHWTEGTDCVSPTPVLLSLPFPMKFSPNYKKIFRIEGKIDHFPRRPYLSPYANAQGLKPGSPE